MDYIHALFFIWLGFHSVLSAPTPAQEKTLYDAIAEKCPSIKELSNFKEQPLFKVCKDWKSISEVNKLTDTNKKEVLCLLYFESFTQYCTHSQTLNLNVSEDVIVQFKLDTVCNYAKTTSNKNLSTIFSTEDNCKKVCADEFGYVNSVCRASFYFAHIEVSAAKSPKNKPASLEEDKKKKLIAAEEQPSLKDKNVVPVGDSNKDKTAAENMQSNKIKNSASIPAPEVPQQKLDDSNAHANLNNAKNFLESGEPDKPDAANAASEMAKDEPSTVAAIVKENEDNADNQQNGVKNPVPGDGGENTENVAPNLESKKVKDQVQPPIKPIEVENAKGQDKVENNPVPEQEPAETDDQEQPDNNIPQDRDRIPHIPNPEMNNPDDEDQLSDRTDDDNAESHKNAVPDEFSKPHNLLKIDEEPVSDATEMDGDSYFFTYFMLLCIIFIVGYVCYHNKQKVLALILEGRKGKRQYRGRRPNSANYHKLDSNLEEAITSSCKKNTSNVIY